MYKQHIVDGLSKMGQIRLFSEFIIFQLSYVGYVSVSPVLRGFFGHVTGAFEKLPSGSGAQSLIMGTRGFLTSSHIFLKTCGTL